MRPWAVPPVSCMALERPGEHKYSWSGCCSTPPSPPRDLLQAGDWEHEKVDTEWIYKMEKNFVNLRFSIPCLRIVNLSFAFLRVAKHWAGVFTKLSVILHMLLSSPHCTHSNLSDHNQLRALCCSWGDGIAPFPGVHHSSFPDMLPHLPSNPAVSHSILHNPLEQLPHIFTATEILCHQQVLPPHLLFQRVCEPVKLQRSQNDSLQEPSHDLFLCLLPCFHPGENFPICPVTT